VKKYESLRQCFNIRPDCPDSGQSVSVYAISIGIGEQLMKKFISILCLAMASIGAQAKDTITIMYAYGPADSVANYHRTLANEANKIQNKYNFIFDAKPGAGGSIASNQVLRDANTILAHSTAFFIRPNVYPNESYDLTQFKEQFVHCTAPMAITSSKFKNWREVAVDKEVTIGISGLGVTTHLAALQVQKKYPKMNIIPFKSTTESMLSMVSGQTDFHIGFISEAEQWTKENKTAKVTVNVLGITGNRVVNGYQPLTKEGFDQSFASMNVGHHLVLPARYDDARAKEFYDIFVQAARAESVRNAYAVDFCEPASVNYNDLPKFFNFHTDYWKKLSEGVKVN